MPALPDRRVTPDERQRLLETIQHAQRAYAEGGRLDSAGQAALRKALLMATAPARACVASRVERVGATA